MAFGEKIIKEGKHITIRSYVHLLSDHVKAAHAAGWTLLEMEEGLVSPGLAAEETKMAGLFRPAGQLHDGLAAKLERRVTAPVFSTAPFTLHQVVLNQAAAQHGGIIAVAQQDFVNLFFRITHARLEGLEGIAQQSQ